MKRALAIAAVATLTSFGLAPAAQAGEVTGNGKPTPVDGHVAASICSFSGLDDVDEDEDPEDPTTDDFGRTQSWGQLPKDVKVFLTSVGANPGNSCKPGGEH
jgi:hypothetical protein